MPIETRPPIADLAAFATIIEHRSFTRAATSLGVSRSALSHTMRSLEQRLGHRLINRTTRSLAPTEAGSRLLSRIGPVLEGFDRALDGFAEEQGSLSGTLRINASVTAVRVLLQDVVPTYLARHPGMVLDLVADGRLVDIVAMGFDAGVRLADRVPQDMIAIPLGGPMRFVAVAAPGYLGEHGRPLVPDDLRLHRCIRHRLPGGRLYETWEFSRAGRDMGVAVPGSLILDDIGLMLDAAAAGQGIAYLPEVAAAPYLDSGRLTILLDDWSPPSPGICLYYTGRRRVPAGLRAFVDVIRELAH